MVTWFEHSARFALTTLLAALTAAQVAGQTHVPPAFSQVPFDQWLTEPEQKGLRWNVHITDPELSNHQRLSARLEINIDGAELAKRRADGGAFVLLMQVSDEQEHKWRDFESVNLDRLPAAVKSSDAFYYRNFFVLPGDYEAVVAAYDINTSEHFLTHRKFHVAALHNDPLPNAWNGLPAVEFVRLTGGPENWFLPFVRSRIKVAAAPSRPTRIDVLLNVSPPDNQAGSARVRNRNLSALLPSFKVLAQMEHENTTLNAAVVNLSRQQIVFQQESVRRLDWPRLLASIADDKPGIIDVKSLEKRHSSPQFFAGEVMRRLNPEQAASSEAGAAPNPAHAVIVLTSPVSFEDGADLRPVEGSVPPDARLFYLRYQPTPTPAQLVAARRQNARHSPDALFGTPRNTSPMILDQLAAVLKPVEPRVYDVTTPEQFRKALASVLAEIAKM